jgi:hypothetical protein
MDPIFAVKSQQAHAYVRPDEMLDADILECVLSTKMRSLIFSIVPDAVLYHFHAYEIVGNNKKSHIFGESLDGWHRDPDSEFFLDDPTHVSIFVYLHDVGDEDGAFEFSPHRPDTPLRTDSPVLSMTGPAGMSFVWHRSYFHRASPNRGPRRRRLLKISVQPKYFPCGHFSREVFKRARTELHIGNVEWDLLFGRHELATVPKPCASRPPQAFRLHPTRSINISQEELAGSKIREIVAAKQPVAHIDAAQRLRVLLVGAGRRIQNNYLPALSCLTDCFEISGIHARTYEKLAPVAERWGVPAVASLEEFDF